MEPPNLPTPHNNFFHFALSHITAARSLIETQVARDVLGKLQLETLRLESGSYVDSNLREKYSDLLLSVDLAETNADDVALVYILFEHKSEPEPLTALQLLSYEIRILERRARDGKPLCPILPLVVYHGERKWEAAQSIDELLRAPEELRPFQIRFSFAVLDLGQLDDAAIEGNAVLQSSLRLLKYARSNQLPGKLWDILRLLAAADDLQQRELWLNAIKVYIMAVNRTMSAEELSRIVHEVFPTQIEPDSIADRLLRQGVERGLEQGLEQGLIKGVISGKIQTLQELLGERPSPNAELWASSLEVLTAQLADLQERVRHRAT